MQVHHKLDDSLLYDPLDAAWPCKGDVRKGINWQKWNYISEIEELSKFKFLKHLNIKNNTKFINIVGCQSKKDSNLHQKS